MSLEEKIGTQILSKISKKINLTPIEKFKELEVLKSLDGREIGSFKAWRGEKLEKFSITEISVAPGMGYTNISLRAESKYSIGTIGVNYMAMPEVIQWDVDLYPPVDLVTHQILIDKYYDQLKDIYQGSKNSPDFKWRLSDHSWMRARTSPYFFMSATPKTAEAKIHGIIHAYCDVWLKMWEGEKEVTPEKAKDIAYRRKCMVEVLLEKEPERHILEKIFGKEMTRRLGEAMTG